MVHILLICCVMLGDDAKPSATTANDRVAYEAAVKKAGQNPAEHVKLALWCEAHGMPTERAKHLKLAVALEPGNSLARGLMGLVAFKGAWAKPDQVEQETQNDSKFQAIFREYLDRRARTPQKADAQLRLAAWCLENGLKEEAMVHYHVVTRIDPSRDIAWIKLGYKKHKDRWNKPEDLAAQKLEADLQRRADTQWKSRLEKLREGLESKVETRRLKAERELNEITDLRAVPMIWKTFGAGGEKLQLITVELLSQIEGPSSSFFLAVLALEGRSPAVTGRAALALARRDPRDVIGRLISLVHRPYKYQVVPGAGPGSTAALMVDGERFDMRRLYRFPDMDVRLAPPMYTLTPNPDGIVTGVNAQQAANLVELNNRLNAGLAAQRQMIIEAAERETMQMNMAIERRLENDVAMLERTNNQISETNSRVLPLLETLTGQTLGADQEPWRKWWTEQLGYVYDDRYSSKPTLTDSVAVPDLSVVAPSVFAALQPHSACFAAGTLVHTMDGERKIESIAAGDRVLAQDTKTGTLSFQPVLATHRNGPSKTLRIAIGNESIVATGIHRFWIAGRGWTMARDLKAGDSLRMIGGTATVESVAPDETQLVYNLTVAADGDFLVGNAGLLVHDYGFVLPVAEPFDRRGGVDRARP